MVKAIRFHQVGGPEVMRLEEVELAAPGAGEARVRHEAIGVNYVDTYHRSGLYPLPLPSGLGVEGAGVVEAVGAGVTVVQPGDRVAYIAGPGAYAQARLLPADRLVKLPAGVSSEQAAAALTKGLTAHMLITRVHAVKAGEAVVVTAAAGGVGQVLVQWLAAIGARVIGVVGSPGKVERVRALGAEAVLVSGVDDVPARVKALAGARRAGGLRLGRGRQLRDLARLPGALRPHGHLRQRLGPGAAGRHRAARAQGLALALPPDRLQPRRDASRPGGGGRGPLRHDGGRENPGGGGRPLAAGAGGRGPPRAPVAGHHRVAAAPAWITPRPAAPPGRRRSAAGDVGVSCSMTNCFSSSMSAMMSRIETSPTTSPPSSTSRWRVV